MALPQEATHVAVGGLILKHLLSALDGLSGFKNAGILIWEEKVMVKIYEDMERREWGSRFDQRICMKFSNNKIIELAASMMSTDKVFLLTTISYSVTWAHQLTPVGLGDKKKKG